MFATQLGSDAQQFKHQQITLPGNCSVLPQLGSEFEFMAFDSLEQALWIYIQAFRQVPIGLLGGSQAPLQVGYPAQQIMCHLLSPCPTGVTLPVAPTPPSWL
jgi:hypothetical protein